MKAKLKVVVNKNDDGTFNLRIYGDGLHEVHNHLSKVGLDELSGLIITSYCLSL